MYNPNEFTASQNLLYNFFRWISNIIFTPRSNVFEVYIQELSTIENQDLQWNPLHIILNIKIIINYFQNWIFDAKYKFQK